MKLSSPPIVTSFELSCARQPIPFNIQTLYWKQIRRFNAQTFFEATITFKAFWFQLLLINNPSSFFLLQEQMVSEDEEDKRTLDIKH